MASVLLVAGTKVSASDRHLRFHRRFAREVCRAAFLAHDSGLPFAEKVIQQSRTRYSAPHFALFNRRLRRVAAETAPDLVLVAGSNWYVQPETVRWLQRRGSRVVLNEQHLQVFRPYQVECLRLYDHVFTQDGALAGVLQGSGVTRKVSVLGPACDPEEHRPLTLTAAEQDDVDADVGCIGYGYPNRHALFAQLAEFKLRLWGRNWDSPTLAPFVRTAPVSGLKKTKIYNATRVNVNLQSTVYQASGVTCRPFEVAACGGFCVADARADLALYFTPGEDLVTFDDAPDLRAKVRYYLDHADERRELATRGRTRVLAAHTYAHRVREIAAAVGLS